MVEAGADVHVIVRGPEVLWGAVPSADPGSVARRLVKPPSAAR